MDTRRALAKLIESADLVRMLEDLAGASPGAVVPPASVNGFRITLANVREAIVSSHDVLAAEMTSKIRPRNPEIIGDFPSIGAAPADAVDPADAEPTPEPIGYTADGSRMFGRRGDLRSSIEKIVGR